MIVTRRGVTWSVEEPVPTGPYREGPFPGFWREWERDNWENDTLDVLDEFVRPGSTVVDLGACIGAHSMGCIGRGANVIAVEPDPVAFEFLVRNCNRNYPGQVRFVNAAIAAHDGECELAAHPQGWASAMSSVTRNDLTDTTVTVPCLTLQTLFEEHDISDCCLVKMDIEGTEVEILESVGPFLAELGVPLHLSTHEPYWAGRSIDPAWLAGYSHVVGSLGGMEHAVAVP